ncbi:cysteine-rich receptor-like protein kinase, partial [Trifolium pratense]
TEFVKDMQILDGILIANEVLDEARRECVSTATTSILVNGSPTDEFPLERGLRQGDPLSHFLFLLTAEGLNVIMQAMVESNVGEQNHVSVSHLQFADDTLLVGSKTWANVHAL